MSERMLPLLDQILTTQDPEQRAAAYNELRRCIVKAEELLPVCRQAITTAMSEAVEKGVTDWGAVNDALRGIDAVLGGFNHE